MRKIKVVIFGAGGIIGQHMLISTPEWAEPIFTRKKSFGSWTGFDVDFDNPKDFLDHFKPDAIVNLAGENRVDIVEANPELFENVNVNFVNHLAGWVDLNDSYLIQCSSQGVFSGNNPRYKPFDTPHPITEYGKHKKSAELIALDIENSEINRLTFVLGVRPFQEIGRKNPLEDIFEKNNQLQVNDRFFSPIFAGECASILWDRVRERSNSKSKINHLGNPVRCSRFSIAADAKYYSYGSLNVNIQPVSHEYFTGIARRPYDTTWDYYTAIHKSSYEDGLINSYIEWSKIKNEY
jgi:dTDP-4-dehydrorhamnose reductase